MMSGFKFTIKWRKSQVWRGFYGDYEGRKFKVRHFKKYGWKLLADGHQISGSPHPVGFAILLRIAEEIYVHKRMAGEALRIAEEDFALGQTPTHGPAPGASSPGIGDGPQRTAAGDR